MIGNSHHSGPIFRAINNQPSVRGNTSMTKTQLKVRRTNLPGKELTKKMDRVKTMNDSMGNVNLDRTFCLVFGSMILSAKILAEAR